MRKYAKLSLVMMVLLLSQSMNADSFNAKDFIEKTQQSCIKRLAIECYRNAQTLINELPRDSAEYTTALRYLANSYYFVGDYETAQKTYRKSLLDAQSKNFRKGEAYALLNLANLQKAIDQKDLSKELEELALLIAEDINDNDILISALVNLGSTLDMLGEYDEAELNYRRALDLNESTQNKELEVYIHLNYGDLLLRTNQFNKSLAQLDIAFTISTELENPYLISASLQQKGNWYCSQKKMEQCESTLKEALAKAIVIKSFQKQEELHKALVEIYKLQKDFEQALYHQEESFQIRKQLVTDRAAQLAEIYKIDRQLAEKDQLLKELQQVTTISKLEKEQARNLFLLILASIIIAVVVLSFTLHRWISMKEIKRQKELNLGLKELDTTKNQILANTSHELRTPLNGIVGLSEYMAAAEDGEISPEQMKQYLKLINSSATHLTELISDILDFNHLNHSELALHKTHFKLPLLLQEILPTVETRADGKEIEIICNIENDLPEVYADRKRVRQIITNLMVNAVKFTHHGSVTLKAELNRNRVKIQVIDTGIGIPESRLEEIFESFKQIELNHSRHYEGVGLGLSIAKKLAELHGSDIEVESQLDEGSTFSFYLDIALGTGKEI